MSFVHDPEIEPSQVAIFNHPDNVGSLKIHHGSGYFDVMSVAGGDRVKALYHPSNQSIAVTPLKDGQVSLRLRDLCLDIANVRAEASVTVVSVKRAELIVQDKVCCILTKFLGLMKIHLLMLFATFSEC